MWLDAKEPLGWYDTVDRDMTDDAARLMNAMTVPAPVTGGTIIRAGYHMAAVGAAIAKASEFEDLVDTHPNVEEPWIFAHDTVEFLARYMDNLATSVRRKPQRFTRGSAESGPSYDPDQLAHYFDRCSKELRAAADTLRHGPHGPTNRSDESD
ncbi:hypothetical protein [Actinoplanes sp. NPDC051859]|uniref:hypothetical protein n=1 Tax=Actinoplanes sp. NPDC051859 TaxID=3363909 RepID=UPI00379D5A5E